MARRRRYRWQSEADLAAQVVRWLRAAGHTVYQEIAGIDIVAVDETGARWAIECKRACNLAVFAQADANRRVAERSSVAVPAVFPDRDGRFARRLAKQFGLGLITVSKPEGGISRLHEAVKAAPSDAVDDDLTPWLNAAAQDHARAGSPAAAAWTPFKQTCQRLRETVALLGPAPLSDIVRALDHHYASYTTARGSLLRILREDGIEGLRVEQRDGIWWIARA